jgi:hypothetical protein
VNEAVIEALKEKYSHLHPLIFHRSLERSKTEGELFDILDTCPNEYPLKWDERNFCWRKCKLSELE